jgi:hypothetical protein
LGWQFGASEADNSSMSMRQRAEWILRNYSAVLAILGLALYVMVRVAYEKFYGSLGVTPEEAGQTYLLIVGRAALGLIVYSLLFLLATSLYALLVGVGQGSKQSLQGRSTRLTRTALRAIMLLVGLLVGVFFIFGDINFTGNSSSHQGPRLSDIPLLKEAVKATYVLLTIYIIRAMLQFVPKSYASVERRARGLNFTTAGIGLSLLAVFILFALGFLQLSERWGESKAEMVKAGNSVVPAGLLAFLIYAPYQFA